MFFNLYFAATGLHAVHLALGILAVGLFAWRTRSRRLPLPERAAEKGAALMDRLRAIQSPVIREIRGRGLWIGIELDRSARPYCEALKDEGVLCKETHDYVIRFAPPLTVSEADLNWAYERVKKVIESFS